jgi:hypothetical protein
MASVSLTPGVLASSDAVVMDARRRENLAEFATAIDFVPGDIRDVETGEQTQEAGS